MGFDIFFDILDILRIFEKSAWVFDILLIFLIFCVLLKNNVWFLFIFLFKFGQIELLEPWDLARKMRLKELV